MSKSIVLVAVCDVRGSTNIPMAIAFIKAGYNVIPINYRTIIQKHGMKFFDKLLIEEVKSRKPDLVLFSKCNGINSDLILECNKYSKTWLWNMDPIQTIQNCTEVVQHAKNATYSSCTGGGVAQWFVENGVKECYTIFDGLDYDIFKPINTEILYDVGFIGTKTKDRNELAEYVNANCYGSGYDKYVVNEDFTKVCCSHKFMLSINTYSNTPYYFSNRLLRYMGCGTCVLHYDPTETLKNIFKDKEELFFFKTKEELKNIINNTSLEKAGKVGLNGRNKVLNNFTWDHTIANILKVMMGDI